MSERQRKLELLRAEELAGYAGPGLGLCDWNTFVVNGLCQGSLVNIGGGRFSASYEDYTKTIQKKF